MAPELTFETLRDTFAETEILRPAAESIPGEITHPETRDFLSRTGLPRTLRNGAVDIDDIGDGGWQTLGALWEEIRPHGWTWTMPEHPERWFSLGGIFGLGLLVLNGETGQVWIIPENDDEDLTPVHSGVDTLAYYMYAIERDRERYSREFALSIERDADDPRDEADAYLAAARALAAELHEVDPTPFVNGIDEAWEDDGEGPWAWIFRDISEGGWSA
ncbi:SUKH-4 family immunity protein [Actinomadura rifamycini]|uniref:SUKH-4 family immunity protein n=1 Tax=Actinomadura rifamycini TaxID=31962 RepID=UPI00041C7BEB|nr:SUKH-4 family immunity protein [Actinomadura rifamycini]